LFASGSCADAGSPATGAGGEAASIRDSAGVTIIESAGPAWSAGPEWRVASVPELEIGREDGPVEYQFQSIAGVVRRGDGSLVVADEGASEVRLYDAAGSFVHATGRRGDGPGEYRLINGIGPGRDDTIWVYDFGLRRFTLLGADLELLRTVTVKADLSSLLAVGMLAAGEFVVRESWTSRAQTAELTPGLRRDPAAIALLDATGALRDTIALTLGREVIISSEGGRATMGTPVIARAATAAIAEAGVVVGDQEVWELRVYTPDGELRRIMRRTGVDLRLGGADVEAAINTRLATVPVPEQPALRLALEALPRPATRPAYDGVLVDDSGHIWAAEWSARSNAPAAWAVFDSAGRYLGDVAMPMGFRPLSMKNGLLAGVWRDDVGVERVRVYRLER
jgi:hypothetical protein